MFINNDRFPSPGAGEDEEQIEIIFHSSRHLNTNIRLLNDWISSVKISNEIQLETIHQGFLSTINRRKELLEQIKQLNKQCQILHERNELIKETNQKRIQLIEEEQKEWRKKQSS